MNVQKSLKELLYTKDCVVIPGFGGFLVRAVSASLHPITYELQPPKKTLSFNADLQQNDGLLINYLAQNHKVSYEIAAEWVEREVKQWQSTLRQSAEFTMEGIGVFSLENDLLHFTPDASANFSIDTYGFQKVKAAYVAREQVQTASTGNLSNWSYAAAVAFAIMVGAASFLVNDQLIQKQWSSFLPINAGVESTREIPTENTFGDLPADEGVTSIEESLEPIVVEDAMAIAQEEEANEEELINEEEENQIKRYQVIGGSFKKYYKAMERERELRIKGYENAVIIGRVGSYYMVAYQTFENYEDALALKRELEMEGKDVFLRP